MSNCPLQKVNSQAKGSKNASYGESHVKGTQNLILKEDP